MTGAQASRLHESEARTNDYVLKDAKVLRRFATLQAGRLRSSRFRRVSAAEHYQLSKMIRIVIRNKHGLAKDRLT